LQAEYNFDESHFKKIGGISAQFKALKDKIIKYAINVGQKRYELRLVWKA